MLEMLSKNRKPKLVAIPIQFIVLVLFVSGVVGIHHIHSLSFVA